jgi:protoheme IX farnesyltransferase
VLFLLQFFWQFPHFWSIAWILDDDYKKAGYQLLPSASGRTEESATQIIIYSAVLIPLSFLPHIFGISGQISMIVVTLGSILLTLFSYRLYKSLSIKDAKRLMFASILYNPLVLISLLIDKI